MDERKIWTDVRISMNLKEKRGGLNERKIWTDIRISMNLKKKDGFWTNGRLQKNKQQKKKTFSRLSDLAIHNELSHYTLITSKIQIGLNSLGLIVHMHTTAQGPGSHNVLLLIQNLFNLRQYRLYFGNDL